VSLKALDLPFSFFDESHTNYSGSRLAGIQYEESAKIKRHRLRLLLNKLTAWRLGLFIADGDLKLPDNVQPQDLKWEWSHAGVPLFDPLKEVSADIAAVNAGFASHQEVCKARGKDFKAIIDEIAEAQAYAKSRGVILSTALPSNAEDDPNKSSTQAETANVEDDKARTENAAKMWQW
jgi:capsid protein